MSTPFERFAALNPAIAQLFTDYNYTRKSKPKETPPVTDSARATTLKGNAKAAEKREKATAFREAAKHLGALDPGIDSEKGRAARALRDEAVRLEAEAKRDEFADKAAPFDQLLTVKSGLSNSRVYGPDAEGRFWRVDQANLSHRPSSQYSQFGYRSARLPGDASQQADIRLIRVEP